MLKSLVNAYIKGNLVLQILVGIALGALLGFLAHQGVAAAVTADEFAQIFGNLFVGALKAVAPILVFVLVCASIATKNFDGGKTGMKKVVTLYLIGTFAASLCAVVTSFLFPTTLHLAATNADLDSPQSIAVVLKGLLYKMVDNPVAALTNANYIGILAWSIGLGVALRFCADSTKALLSDAAAAITKIVQFVIKLAPFGIFGLVSTSVAQTGISTLLGYAKLLAVLVGVMLFVAFVVNALIVFLVTKKNPYPLIFTCIKESAITAFFTRSSAANIPVNLNLCKKLGVSESLYSISIPLGATINMAGAAVTIAVLSLSAVNTLGIEVTFGSAFVLSLLAAVGACGASGVAGGSLMLIPLACALFGIGNDTAMQVVAVGFIIGVVQDSVETALNSSTDVLFTAIADESKAS